jgi:DNA-binding IclR family transcriptional regulator
VARVNASEAVVTVPAVHRAVAVLDFVAGRSSAQPLHAISRELGIPRSSALGICRTLVSEDVLRQDANGHYFIGPRLVRLAGRTVIELDLASTFTRAIEGLGENRWTLQVATRVGHEVVFLARRDGSQPLSLAAATGRPLPASTTAVGKAMLATMGGAALAALYGPTFRLPAFTDSSLTTFESLVDALAETRERGYAVDNGETMTGIRAAAAPVFGAASAEAVAAVSATTVDVPGAASVETLAHAAQSVAQAMTRALAG